MEEATREPPESPREETEEGEEKEGGPKESVDEMTGTAGGGLDSEVKASSDEGDEADLRQRQAREVDKLQKELALLRAEKEASLAEKEAALAEKYATLARKDKAVAELAAEKSGRSARAGQEARASQEEPVEKKLWGSERLRARPVAIGS